MSKCEMGYCSSCNAPDFMNYDYRDYECECCAKHREFEEQCRQKNIAREQKEEKKFKDKLTLISKNKMSKKDSIKILTKCLNDIKKYSNCYDSLTEKYKGTVINLVIKLLKNE